MEYNNQQDVVLALISDLLEGSGRDGNTYDEELSSMVNNTITLLHTLSEMGYNFARTNVESNGRTSTYEVHCIAPDGVYFSSQGNMLYVNSQQKAFIVDKFIIHIWVMYSQTVAENMRACLEAKPKHKARNMSDLSEVVIQHSTELEGETVPADKRWWVKNGEIEYNFVEIDEVRTPMGRGHDSDFYFQGKIVGGGNHIYITNKIQVGETDG